MFTYLVRLSKTRQHDRPEAPIALYVCMLTGLHIRSLGGVAFIITAALFQALTQPGIGVSVFETLAPGERH